MKTLTIDTYRVVEVLQQKGFSKDQAEGLLEAAKEVDTSEIATKDDVQQLRLATKTDLQKVIMWVAGLLVGQIAINTAIMALMFNLYG